MVFYPRVFLLQKIVNLYEKKQSDPFVLIHIFVLIIVVKRKKLNFPAKTKMGQNNCGRGRGANMSDLLLYS